MTRFDRQPDFPPRGPQGTGGNVGRFIAGVFVGMIGLPMLLMSCLTQLSVRSSSLLSMGVTVMVVVVLVRSIRQRREANVGRHFAVGVATGFCMLLLLFGVCFAVLIKASGH